MTRWPVEETGKNSVSPSIIPRTKTVNQSGMECLDAKKRFNASGKSRGKDLRLREKGGEAGLGVGC